MNLSPSSPAVPDTGPPRRSWKRRFPREFSWPLLAGGLLIGLLFFLTPQQPSYEASTPYEFPAFQTLELKVSDKGLWHLRARREQAMRDQVLLTQPGDWVGGELSEGGQTYPVKVRLKGDWTDHLQQGKWSFRVALKDSLAYRGMSVFSLQSPRTRSFLREWYFHQVLIQEDILTPRFEFVRLHFNGAELGIYALEEHFTKEMIEARGFREGPVLKLNEDGLWEARRLALAHPALPFVDLPLYEAAHPEAFGANKYLERPKALARDHQARTLVHSYKYALRPTRELFDLDRMARAYALIDLFRGHHSLVWHNRRFYYEPLTSRLHPVVYDAFSGDVSGRFLNGPFTGYASNGRTWYDGRIDLLGTRFFAEPEFVRAYYQYLHQYTTPAFLDSLTARYAQPLQQRRNFLRREYLFYDYSPEQIRNQAEQIRAALEVKPEWLVQSPEDGWCIQSEAPVALEIRAVYPDDRTTNYRLLSAYDGRQLADQVQYAEKPEKLEVRVPGGGVFDLKPNSSEDSAPEN